jgi:hypothetical protein
VAAAIHVGSQSGGIVTHQVFISYSSKDKIVGDAACAILERRGQRCWIAPRDISPGQEWGEAIIDGIMGARVFVLVFSDNANGSPQVRREIERAVHHGLPVIPFRIEDVPPAKSLEYFMSAPHWLDALTPPLEQHLDRLADSVDRLLGGEPGDSPDRPRWQPASAAARPASSWIRALAIGAAFAAAPLIATLAGADPPWPAGIGYVSVALLLAAAIAAHASPGAWPVRVRLWTWLAFGLATAGLLAALILSSMFVETIPGSGVRVVRGTVCTPDALLVYKEACPDLPRDALRDAEWEAAALWTRSSVTTIRVALAASWLVFVAGLAIAAAALVRRR